MLDNTTVIITTMIHIAIDVIATTPVYHSVPIAIISYVGLIMMLLV